MSKKIVGIIKSLYRGRLGRLDYLFSFSLLFIASVPFYILASYIAKGGLFGSLTIPLAFILFLAVSILSLLFFSLHIRRLHDAGMSAWWLLLLIFFNPWPKLIFLIFLLLKNGTAGENKHGIRIDGGSFLKRVFNWNEDN